MAKYKVVWFITSHLRRLYALRAPLWGFNVLQIFGTGSIFPFFFFFLVTLLDSWRCFWEINETRRPLLAVLNDWLLRAYCLNPAIPSFFFSSCSSSVSHTHMLIPSLALSSMLLLLLFRWPQCSAIPRLPFLFSFSCFSPVFLLLFAHPALLSWLSKAKRKAGRILCFSLQHMLSITLVSGMISTS